MRPRLLPVLLLVAGGLSFGFTQAADLTVKEQLGKSIFFDENLSINGNQSCATCHGPTAGWTGPDSVINAHGSV
jgi:cytochrome c peroxidase